MIFSNWLGKTSALFTQQERADLRMLCASVTENLRLLGYRATSFSREAHQRPKNFAQRLEWMKTYNELLELQLASATSCKSEKELMWKFFAKLRLIPTSDIFDRITDDHFIEIYDLNGDQMYRSLNYFNLVSLTVEDLLHFNWKRDYKRSKKINLSLLGLTARIFAGRFHETYDCAKVPQHEVSEAIADRYLFELNLRCISPLKQNGKCVAVVAVSNARRLDPIIEGPR